MKKSEKTRQEILETAIKVFKSRRFENGSINEIAKRLGIRNSTVYYYFKNKEEIFKELVKSFRDRVCSEIEKAVEGRKAKEENIIRILYAYKECIRKNPSLYDIFREIEFVERDFAKSFYTDITERIKISLSFNNGLDKTSIAYAILGSIYFVVIKNIVWDGKKDINEEFSSVIDFIENGIDKKSNFKPFIIKEKKILESEEKFSTRGKKTKLNLIKAAERLFGEQGYEKTQISDIARLSKKGLGTFYIYFKSKKEALEELVRNINHRLRSNSWEYFKDYSDRREIENAGIQAFFYQFKTMGKDYRIVREAEFVDKKIGIWYYTRIASAYKIGLEEGIKKEEISEINAETLSYILMGISHTVGIEWFVLDDQKEIPEHSVISVLEFVMHGLKGIKKGGAQ